MRPRLTRKPPAAKVRVRAAKPRGGMTLVHDLGAQRDEILTENEQLLAAQAALEVVRDQYVDLYDFAPIAYATLDTNGSILQLNLAACSLLGKARQALSGAPLVAIAERTERSKVMNFLHLCRHHQSGPGPTLDIKLRTANGIRSVKIFSRPRVTDTAREILTAFIDVTEQAHLESERDALVGRLITIQEDERRRIARDAHDHLGQRVTSLRLALELVAQNSGDGSVRAYVLSAQAQAQRLDQELDFFTGELRPSSLDDLGLPLTLGHFIRDWSETFKVPAQFQVNHLGSDVHFRPDVETNFYRITQEALNNIHKHAAATCVSVILERRERRLVLIVEDDGKGFDAGGRTKRRGLGLTGMRERVALMQGKIEIESSLQRGTTVFVQVPWDAAHNGVPSRR